MENTVENSGHSENKELVYIEPNLSVYDTLEELLNDKNYDGNFSFLEKKHVFRQPELLQGGSFFVLGEPGSGKTTLLSQTIVNAEREQLFAKKLLLTSIRPEELEATLTTVYNEESQKRLVFEPDNYVFCLDGLDEVNSEIFSGMINEIIRFNKIYPKFKLIVSCRTHYLSKSLNIIRAATDFKFVKIQPFTSNQIIEYIKTYAGEDYAKAFSTKINSYLRDDFNSILRVPRYLDIQIKVAKESNSVQEFGEMKRADFFEKFIYQKLEKDEGRQEKNVLTKRVLEKLALIMEIYQVNKITKDELITFLDEADSNINLIFLNTESIDNFISRVLKSTDFVIEFDNTEFQEYLAAKELLRLGQKSQILFDLIVEPNFKQIFPNWFDVLKYVVEIDPTQLVNIIEFLRHRIERLVSDDLFTLLGSVDTKKLNENQKGVIFEIVHDYFQKHNIFIGKYASTLSEFYTDSNETLFNIETFTPYSTRVSNQLYLLSYLLEDKLFKPTDKLIKSIKDSILLENNTDLIMQFISILEKSNSWDALVEVSCVKDKNNEIFKSFFRAAFEVNTNHEFCLNLIFEAISKKVEEVIHYFNEISDPILVKRMIKTMTEDLTILESFVDRTEHFYPREYYKIFRVIDEIWDSEINTLLLKQHEHLLINVNEYELRNVNYFKELVACLSRHNEDFLKTFLSFREPYVYFGFFGTLYDLIGETNVLYLKGYSATPGGSNLLYQLFNHMKTSDPIKYSKLKTFIQEESYEIYQAVEAFVPNKKSDDDRILEDFSHQLEPKPEHYNFGVFNILLKNKELILSQVASEKIDRLKTIILTIFQKTNADLLNIKITAKGEGRSYNISNKYVYEYPTYLEAALVLGMKDQIQFVRESFIKLLPLNEDSSKTKIISDFIGEISQDEIALFTDYCKKRTDDFLLVFASNFIRIVKDHKIVGLLPMVKGLLADMSIYPHEKTAAIQCIAEVETNKDSLLKYVSDFLALPDGFKYAETVNECLILKYADKDAILWRLEELKKRKFKFTKSHASGMRPYTDDESELDRGTFANCLIGLRNFELMSDFNELLSISFEIRSDKDYHEYSNYLQRVVFNFYKDLKYSNSIAPLKGLTGFYDSNTSLHKASFKNFLKDLEIEYSQSVLKPDNIFDCVKKYNSLKKNTYLPISNDFELLNIIRDIINDDLNNFISNEGFYKPIKKDMTEDMMQKILKVQIENSLYKKGFRTHDVYREPQLHNDKRPDFVISYGFIGPIVIELKFISNPEISNATKRLKYKMKLENNYRRGFNAKYGIYLVLEKDKRNRSVLKQNLSSEYADLKEWHIHFLKCYQD